jgi:hypothetical protein
LPRWFASFEQPARTTKKIRGIRMFLAFLGLDLDT